MTNTIYIHTDGSSNKDKTVGGWAFCLSNDPKEDPTHTDSGQIFGTHNTAELTAVLNSLHYIAGKLEHNKVVIFTDSKYVSDPLYFDSLRVWESNGWKTLAGTPVANVELWKELKLLIKSLSFRGVSVEVRWVRGHNGNKLNELVDKLAVEARKNGDKNKLYG